MGKEVYANGNAVAGKVGGGKVIAAFPNVCMSPPSPPAGPIPLPYPCTSTSSDLKSGSKKVKVGNKPIALKGKSFYKSSPLGNEAATRSFGACLLTHQITGKTYFQASSMDVTAEGKKVCRHIDIMTSNHSCEPGGTPPIPNLEKLHKETLKKLEADPDACPCCGGEKHANGQPQSGKDWYEGELKKRYASKVARKNKRCAEKLSGVPGLLTSGISNNQIKKRTNLEGQLTKELKRLHEEYKTEKDKLEKLLKNASERPDCECPPPAPHILPSSPCDTFYETPADSGEQKKQKEAIQKLWMDMKGPAVEAIKKLGGAAQVPHALSTMKVVKVVGGYRSDDYMHKTPRAAGGCPVGAGNLQNKQDLCKHCKEIDDGFGDFQGGWVR